MTESNPALERETYKEKLEAAHTFPGPFTFKLFGPNGERFELEARRVLGQHLPNAKAQVSAHLSSKETYQCVTIVVDVPDADMVIDMYADFNAIDGLRMMM